jgi:hypothetical protein
MSVTRDVKSYAARYNGELYDLELECRYREL